MKTVIIDYGMGNLKSVKRAFEECGADVLISEEPRSLSGASHIVLPGVGSFKDAIENLNKRGFIESIKNAVSYQVPFIGICLGMQLLVLKGYEGGECDGLGIFSGTVNKLEPESNIEKIPHVGWNEIRKQKESLLLKDIPDNSDFYFVHSYNLVNVENSDILTTTPYCGNFVSSIECKNVFGVQFHPEKSGKLGFRLIRNFLNIF